MAKARTRKASTGKTTDASATITEDAIRKVLTRTGKSTRDHNDTFPVDKILFDPEDNVQRWLGGTGKAEAAMTADLFQGETGKSYAILLANVKARGVEEPVGLYPAPDKPGMFRGIFGMTRIHAAISANLKEIPAYIYPADISKQERLVLQGRENNPNLKRRIEWPAAVHYIKAMREEFGHMSEKVWDKAESQTGYKKGTLARMARTWEQLNPAVREAATAGRIDAWAAEKFYTKDGPRFTDKEAASIIASAGVDAKGNLRERITVNRVDAAISTLSKEGDIAPPKKAGTKLLQRPNVEAMRDSISYAITAYLPEEGVGETTEKELDEIVESRDMGIALGLAMALGDFPVPVAEGVTEDDYEESLKRHADLLLLGAIGDNFMDANAPVLKDKEGNETPWIDGKGELLDGTKAGNKKRLAELVEIWAGKEKIEVSAGKGKTKIVEATSALRALGFAAELDEIVAGDMS